MCYVTFELLFKSGQGLLVCFQYKKKVILLSPEGNVHSCLYSGGRRSNKSHEEYDAGEESSTLFSNNKNETQMCHFCLLVWLSWIIEGQ